MTDLPLIEIRDEGDKVVRPHGLYSVPEAKRALNCSRAQIYVWMKAGLLSYTAAGPKGHRRIFGHSILTLLQPAV